MAVATITIADSSTSIGALSCSLVHFYPASKVAAAQAVHTTAHSDMVDSHSAAVELVELTVVDTTDSNPVSSTLNQSFDAYRHPGCLIDSCRTDHHSANLHFVDSHYMTSYRGHLTLSHFVNRYSIGIMSLGCD